MTVHLAFDLLAAACALLATVVVYRWRLQGTSLAIDRVGAGYAIVLVAGAAIGGFGLGTLNLWLSGVPGVGRSIIGALAGAIAAVELYKWRAGIAGSTGVVFVVGFATSVAIGRWGCYFSGLDDMTHGVATSMPLGHDFGDGILRHPVQIYESIAMAMFLAFAFRQLWHRDSFFLANGFYLLVLCYAAQRFAWEFLKPYAAILGPFNLFHFICAGLAAYAVWMMLRGERKSRIDGARAPV